MLSFLIVQAFGAAAIGAFRSIPLAYVGGIVVGLAQAVTSKQIAGHQFLAGLDTNMPFLILLVILICLPRGRLVEVGKLVKARAVPQSSLPVRTRFAGGSAVLVGAAGAAADRRFPATTVDERAHPGGPVLLPRSAGLLVRADLLVPMGFCRRRRHDVRAHARPRTALGLAVLVAALLTVPVGALVSSPAIRLSGLYLGLATLGFGVLLAGFFYERDFMFGVGTDLATHRPHFLNLDSERGFYYLLLVIAVAALGLIAVIEKSRLGRLLRGLADSPVALSTLGTNINQTRMIVFSICGLPGRIGRRAVLLAVRLDQRRLLQLPGLHPDHRRARGVRPPDRHRVGARPPAVRRAAGIHPQRRLRTLRTDRIRVFAVAAALLSQTSLRDRLSRTVVAEDGRRSVDRSVRTTPDRIAARSAVRTSATGQ